MKLKNYNQKVKSFKNTVWENHQNAAKNPIHSKYVWNKATYDFEVAESEFGLKR